MVRGVIRYLDLGADSITASDAGITGVKWRVINATALASFLKSFAGEPVIAPAWLALLAV